MCYENKFLKMKFRFVLVSQDLEWTSSFSFNLVKGCSALWALKLFGPRQMEVLWA